MNCGHAHADALAFELAAEGRTLFTDPGTYTYTYSLGDRDEYRSTEAHNTLTVDGLGASVMGGPFEWKHIANTNLEAWISRPSFDYFRGTHDGYQRLQDPVTHRREVLFLKNNYWVIRDTLSCKTEHEVALHFHLDPKLTAKHLPNRFDLRLKESSRPSASVVTFGSGQFVVRSGRVSPGYRRELTSLVCKYEATLRPSQSLVTWVLPGHSLAEGEWYEEEEGQVFRVVGVKHEDTLVFDPPSDRLQSLGIETDFRVLWIRRSRSNGRLLQFVGIEGTRLLVDEHVAFGTRSAVGYAAFAPAQCDDVDTDACAPFQSVMADTPST